jgi:alpha-tubulin suppressor-like RCC1 family protein
VPIKIFASGVAAISGGLVHSVILKADHSLWTTGYNNNGELGNGSGSGVLTPVQIKRPSLSKDDQ